MMKLIDVYAMLDVLGEVPKKNRGGFLKGVRPALTREDAAKARKRALPQVEEETNDMLK